MNKILFPTDFSENASLAIPFVIQLANKLQAEVFVLHTYQLPYHRSDMFMSVTDIMKKDAEEGVDKIVNELKAMPGGETVVFTPVVRVGAVSDACQDLCDEKGIGLIIMGTTGATGLEEVFLGSNAASVISDVDVPVLCIPAGQHQVIPSKVCLAYDLENPGIEALMPLKNLCSALGTEVLVLNVTESGDTDEELDKAAAGVKLGHALEGVKHDFFLAEGDVEESLFNFSKQYNPDWIVLVHHHRGFFKRIFSNSLTKKVAYHTKLPLLALHQPKEK